MRIVTAFHSREFSLKANRSSRSFADMRVEIVAELPAPATAAPPAESRAMPAFLAAVNGDDSLFQVLQFATWLPAPHPETHVHGFAGNFVLGFREDELNRNRGLYFSLLEKLAELLREVGSADALEARLGLTRGSSDANRIHLALRLLATGNSPEQAELRWGLGLVHVQQALLFTSRHLRQQLSPRTD